MVNLDQLIEKLISNEISLKEFIEVISPMMNDSNKKKIMNAISTISFNEYIFFGLGLTAYLS